MFFQLPAFLTVRPWKHVLGSDHQLSAFKHSSQTRVQLPTKYLKAIFIRPKTLNWLQRGLSRIKSLTPPEHPNSKKSVILSSLPEAKYYGKNGGALGGNGNSMLPGTFAKVSPSGCARTTIGSRGMLYRLSRAFRYVVRSGRCQTSEACEGDLGSQVLRRGSLGEARMGKSWLSSCA